MKDWKFQWSDNINGQIIVVRADTWQELMLDVETARKDFNKPSTGTTSPSSPTTGAVCRTCGAATLPEKRITGKDGRSWWIQDCSTGDRTHKGPIRPAN